MFTTSQAPTEVKALAAWAVREIQRLANTQITPQVRSSTFEVLHAEPPQVYAGQLVNADGSDWNPGNGSGLYRRDEGNTRWVHELDLSADGTMIVPAFSGAGIQVDAIFPTYPWRDLEGPIRPRSGGAGKPTLTTYRAPLEEYAFVANDVVDLTFHWPHDWVPGTDIYLHIHWSHTGTNVTGSLVVDYSWSFAKGHNQESFPAPSTFTQTFTGLNITDYPQYQHNIGESQFSAAVPSGGQVDADSLEADGLMFIQAKPTTIPTVTGGSFFIHYVDIHYQSSNLGTKGKAPPFFD